MPRTQPVATFVHIPPRPYSLSLTAARFTRFPELVDIFDGRTYGRLLWLGTSPLLVAVEQIGSPWRAELQVCLTGRASGSPDAVMAAGKLLSLSLGASSAVRQFYRSVRADAILGPAVRDFAGLRVAGVPDLWEGLVTTILCQQVNLSFAYSIRCELVRAFGSKAEFGGRTWHSFPAPSSVAGLSIAELRGFRLSRAKAETIARLARAFCAGEITAKELASLPDEAVLERLTAFKGIGLWTAETVLLRALGRLDAFPAGDLGIVKYLAQGLFGYENRAGEADMRGLAEAWRPYRGLALVYAAAELMRRKSQAVKVNPAARVSRKSRPKPSMPPA